MNTKTSCKVANLVGHPIIFKVNDNRILKKNSIVVDCGACLGRFTDEISSIIPVYSYLYEPNLELYNQLCEKYKSNNMVSVYNLGISDTSGTKEFYIGNSKKSSSLDKTHRNLSNVSYTVETITIENIVNKLGTVDLLKMDIEGEELKVLKGIKREIFDKINQITLEYHVHCSIDNYTVKDVEECHKYLCSNGFDSMIGKDENVCYFKR